MDSIKELFYADVDDDEVLFDNGINMVDKE